MMDDEKTQLERQIILIDNKLERMRNELKMLEEYRDGLAYEYMRKFWDD